MNFSAQHPSDTKPKYASGSIFAPDFDKRTKSHGIWTVEIGYDCSGGAVFLDQPSFRDQFGAVVYGVPEDLVEVVSRSARPHLEHHTRDWHHAEGGQGTLIINLDDQTFDNEGYERRIIYEARINSGRLADL